MIAFRSLVVSLFILFALSACGGGGGGTPPPNGNNNPPPGGDTNHDPVADAGNNQAVIEGDVVELDGAASSDEDGDTLTYAWTQTAGPNVELDITTTLAPTFTAPDVAAATVFAFELAVSDGDAEATDSVEITVQPSTLDIDIADMKTLGFSWDSVSTAHHYRLLENADGASGYSVHTGNIDKAATNLDVTIPVHLLDWANASYFVEACLNADCSNAISTNNVTLADIVANAAIGYFKASNTNDGDFFGSSVALSADGNTLVVGTDGEDGGLAGVNPDDTDNTAPDAGAVFVFVRNPESGVWAQQAYLKASNAEEGDEFGTSVAVSSDGNTLVVGAIGEDSAATGIGGAQGSNTVADSGAVYVFVRDPDTAEWTQQAYVKASNTGTLDEFGTRVVLSADGNVMAVSAPRERSPSTGINGDQGDDITGILSGAVYVFSRTGTAWAQQAYVKASNTESQDRFGEGLALSADGATLAVGAFLEDSAATGIGGNQTDDCGGALTNCASASGAVYVFTHNGVAWSQQAYVKASNAQQTDNFGTDIALSDDGDTMVVAASLEDGADVGVNGAEGSNGGPDAGAVYVFTREGTTWTQEAYVKASNTGTNDKFGSSVALSGSGDMLAIGAVAEASAAMAMNGDQVDDTTDSAGAVYVFVRDAMGWSQKNYVKSRNTAGFQQFGFDVALSADGEILVGSADLEGNGVTGINGEPTPDEADSSGAVYVY